MEYNRYSRLPTLVREHLANLLVRNSTEWVNLHNQKEFGFSSVLELNTIAAKLGDNYTLKDLCYNLVNELNLSLESCSQLTSALRRQGLLGLAAKIRDLIESDITPDIMAALANFESRDKLRGNTHVILFPNLDDADIEKMAAKMKTDLTLEETDVLDGNKKVCLTIHWLETTANNIKTSIALVNMHGEVEKAWPMFIRQFGQPPNISIVQFTEAQKNYITIPKKLVTTTSEIKLSEIDELLFDYWRHNDDKNCCSHESHVEISVTEAMPVVLENVLQHVSDVDYKVFFSVSANNKEYMIDQIACFLQCWTMSYPTNIKNSQTVIAQMTFAGQIGLDLSIPTSPNGNLILAKEHDGDNNFVIFATTTENYWRLWIDYEDIKAKYKSQGLKLTSMTPVSRTFLNVLRQLDDTSLDLIQVLSFFVDDVEQKEINIADYSLAERGNSTATTFFRNVANGMFKEFSPKEIEMAMEKAWPKEDFNTKPQKLNALLEYCNVVPSDKTHNGLNTAWNNARQTMKLYYQSERVALSEAPSTYWYCNWMWTLIKKSTKLKTLLIPGNAIIPNIFVINALKAIPDYIALEWSTYDINVKAIIDSLCNKTIVLRRVVAGPVPLPNTKKNRITVEVVQFVGRDTSALNSVLQNLPTSKPDIMLPHQLMDQTSVMIEMCKKINCAVNYEVQLELTNAEQFAKAYPLIPKPITVRGILNYFDTLRTNLDLEFEVLYEDILEVIPLQVHSVEAAVQLKKHLVVQDYITQKPVDMNKIYVVQNKILINCSPGKFYSIKRQIKGFAPSAEIIVPVPHIKLAAKNYPDMSQSQNSKIFLENAKKLDSSNQTPMCYFCKAPLQDEYDLINLVNWAKFRPWSSETTLLPVHPQCNSHNEHLFTITLQPKPFSFPLVVRTLAMQDLHPAAVYYLLTAEDYAECQYENLDASAVFKIDELEYNMEDEDWRKLSEQFLHLLLTSYEYDMIDKSLVSVNRDTSQKCFSGTYFGTDVIIKTIPTKGALKELLWLKLMKFSSIVPFLGYYYEDKDTCYLVFEKMACDLSTMKLADLKKEVRLNIAKQVCAAMSYLHSKGFVHRRLQLQQVLLDNQHNAKLKLSGSTNTKNDVKFSAPEILEKGTGSATKACDVYAFGIMLLEVATTKSAWEGRSDKQIADTIKNGWFPESLRKIDDLSDLYQLIAACLDKDPERRPPFIKICEALRKNELVNDFL